VPMDFGPAFDGTLEALLADQTAFGRMTRFGGDRIGGFPMRRAMPSSTERSSDPRGQAGRAYWLISREEGRIETAPVIGTSIPTDSAFVFVLEPGWNMIGDPFDFSVAWDSVLVNGQTMAEAESCWWSRRSSGWWVKGTRTMCGCWSLPRVLGEKPADADVTLEIRPGRFCCQRGQWCRRINGRHPLRTRGNSRSVRGRPRPQRTRTWSVCRRSPARDGTEWTLGAPDEPGSSLSLYVVRGREWLARIFAGQRPTTGNLVPGYREDFLDLARWRPRKDRSGRSRQIPEDAKVYLIDRTLDQMTDLRANPMYECFVGVRKPMSSEDNARFALLVGAISS